MRYHPKTASQFAYLSPSEQLQPENETRALDIERLKSLMIWENEK
jgi:hypothetical protein